MLNLAPGLRCLCAPNPGPMTERGTNTYLLGTRDIAVIDPGPENAAHLAAILAALQPGQRVSHILITHSHRDHSPLARALAETTGARVHAFGPSHAGRTATQARLAAGGLVSGGEGVDVGFAPDIAMPDRARIAGSDWTIVAHWTPGHMANHMCFEWVEGNVVFTGDLIMGWASSLISPPDGDVGQFLQSLDRVEHLGAKVLHAGHGAPIEAPSARIAWLRAHRLERRARILAALGPSGVRLPDLLPRIYADVPQAMWPAASRNLFAHLIELVETGHAHATPTLGESALFSRIAPPE